MSKGRVLVTTKWICRGGPVDALLEAHGYESTFSSEFDGGAPSLASLVATADGVIAGTERLSESVLRGAAHLRVIARPGAGYDNIDVAAATRLGITVCATPGGNRQSVAEFTIGLLLSVARGIPANIIGVREGGWPQPSGRELAGATLGLVGFGTIGQSVAAMGRALGMTMLAFDVRPDHAAAARLGVTFVDLDTLLGSSDFVSLHLALTEKTYRIIDASRLATMKHGAYLVNTSRGGVVDEDALADALTRGSIAGAALDVVEQEPLRPGSPLRSAPNVYVTAHVGAATEESRQRTSLSAARSVIELLDGGTPDTIVNSEVLAASTRMPDGADDLADGELRR